MAARKPKRPPVAVLRLRWQLLGVADRAFLEPPSKPWIVRPVPRGHRVARFLLPLELCQATNRTGRVAGAEPWRRAKAKTSVWLLMRAQSAPWDEPLPGRPQVLCTRFSRAQSDTYADWAKLPVDMLCAPRGTATARRLNIITDDRPAAAEVVQWCEPMVCGFGFVLIDVWSEEFSNG